MSRKHLFFQKLVSPLLAVYERAEAEEIAYRLIDAYLGKTRLEFWDIASTQSDLDADELTQKLDLAIERILDHEPVQYVIGYTYFLDHKLMVTPDVLIPRQETEELASLIIQKEKGNQNLRILDIGTGSGCLPIALAQNLNCQKVIGADISTKALEVARQNAVNNQSSVDFLELDVLTRPIPEGGFDIIVSNPPYVLESDKKQMDLNVLKHEPELALFVSDDDPLKFYKAIASIALTALQPKGRLYLEIHEGFGRAIQELLENLGYKDVVIHQDLFLGKDRMIFTKRG